MGFRAIGRILHVSNVTVLNWIHAMGKSVKAYVQEHLPDDWKIYKSLPARKRLIGRKHTTNIESLNANI